MGQFARLWGSIPSASLFRRANLPASWLWSLACGACLYPQLLRGLRKHGHEFQASLGSTVKHTQTDTSNQPLLLLGCAGEQLSRRAPAWQTQSPLLHLAPRKSYVECKEQQWSQGPEVPNTANGEGTGEGSTAMFLISGEKFSPVSAVFDIWFTIYFFSKLEFFFSLFLFFWVFLNHK